MSENYWLKYHMEQIGDPEYYQGVKDGIRLYAHYEDGVTYVGTSGTTYKEAIAEVDAAHEFMKQRSED